MRYYTARNAQQLSLSKLNETPICFAYIIIMLTLLKYFFFSYGAQMCTFLEVEI